MNDSVCYYNAFVKLLDYFRYKDQCLNNMNRATSDTAKAERNKSEDIKNEWKQRSAIYENLLSRLDFPLEIVFKLIIAAKAYLDKEEDDKYKFECKYSTDSKIKHHHMFKTGEKIDPNMISTFCTNYKKMKRTKDSYSYTFREVSKYIYNNISTEMHLSYKTVDKILLGQDTKFERIASVCRCLDLDSYLSTFILKSAGYDVSPYSQNKKMREVYYLFEFPPEKKTSAKDYLILYQDKLRELGINDIKLTSKKESK